MSTLTRPSPDEIKTALDRAERAAKAANSNPDRLAMFDATISRREPTAEEQAAWDRWNATGQAQADHSRLVLDRMKRVAAGDGTPEQCAVILRAAMELPDAPDAPEPEPTRKPGASAHSTTYTQRTSTMSAPTTTPSQPMSREQAAAQATKEWAAMSAADRSRWSGESRYVAFRKAELAGLVRVSKGAGIGSVTTHRSSARDDKRKLPDDLPVSMSRDEVEAVAKREFAAMAPDEKARWFNEKAYTSYRKATARRR